MIREMKEEKSLLVKFRYVHADQNPAGLLIRGITLEKFQQNLSLWSLGPEWHSKSPIEWPTSELQKKNKFIVQFTSLNYTVTNSETQPVIPLDKYSGFNKLINVTANIHKIRNKLNHVNQDRSNSAKIYLFNVMQQQSLVSELAHLQSPKG